MFLSVCLCRPLEVMIIYQTMGACVRKKKECSIGGRSRSRPRSRKSSIAIFGRGPRQRQPERQALPGPVDARRRVEQTRAHSAVNAILRNFSLNFDETLSSNETVKILSTSILRLLTL